jgi:hypothetical protein
VCWKSQEGNKDDMIDFWKLRTELRMLEPADLLQMAFNQKDHNCVLNPNGSCQFYFKYKGFGFCVSELSGQGCQAEKARQGVEDAETFITPAEAKNGNEKVLGVGEPDRFRNRISQSQSTRKGNQW